MQLSEVEKQQKDKWWKTDSAGNKTPTAAAARQIYRIQSGLSADDDTFNADEFKSYTDMGAAWTLGTAAQVREPLKSSSQNETPATTVQDKVIDRILSGNTNEFYQKADSMQAPTYTSQYDATINQLVQDILKGGKYEADPNVAKAADAIVNRQAFSYDVNSDPLFASYKDQYTRGAKQSADNAMGAAVAASGGYGNSYAAALASQQYNAQMQGLADAVPTLYEKAYDKYIAEGQDLVNNYNILAAEDEKAYARYLDEQNQKLQNYSMLRDMEDSDYSKYRDLISDYLTERNYNVSRGDAERADTYNQFNAEMAQEQWDYQQNQDAKDNALQDALTLAEVGDFSGLANYFGKDMSEAEERYKQQFAAALYGETGLISVLDAVGFDTTEIKEKVERSGRADELALAITVYEVTGDPGLLNAFGIDTGLSDEMNEYQRIISKNAATGYSGSGGSGSSTDALAAAESIEVDVDGFKSLIENGSYEDVENKWIEYAMSGASEEDLTELALLINEKYTDFNAASALEKYVDVGTFSKKLANYFNNIY